MNSNTDIADYAFTVKESTNGSPWIMLEPRTGDLNILKSNGAFLGFQLRSGISLDEAKRFAGTLNENIENVSCTTLR